jgi:hypothetical protein
MGANDFVSTIGGGVFFFVGCFFTSAFVAVCGDTCQMIKLVDRIEFARANFNLAKDWKL